MCFVLFFMYFMNCGLVLCILRKLFFMHLDAHFMWVCMNSCEYTRFHVFVNGKCMMFMQHVRSYADLYEFVLREIIDRVLMILRPLRNYYQRTNFDVFHGHVTSFT